eukprot:4237408-Prymnesium_polylepis.1
MIPGGNIRAQHEGEPRTTLQPNLRSSGIGSSIIAPAASKYCLDARALTMALPAVPSPLSTDSMMSRSRSQAPIDWARAAPSPGAGANAAAAYTLRASAHTAWLDSLQSATSCPKSSCTTMTSRRSCAGSQGRSRSISVVLTSSCRVP